MTYSEKGVTHMKLHVVGSVNMDLVLQADRLPVSGESRLGNSYTFALGGKGANQAVAAARQGADVQFAGAVGDDLYGRELRGSLVREKIGTDRLLTSSEATGFAVIMLEGADNRILVFAGANHAITPEDVLPALEERPDAVLLQLEIPFEVVCAVCHAADRLGIPAVVDLGPAIRADFSRLGRVEILSPNRTELESATGMPAETDEELPSALQKLYETVPCRYIVLKDGSSGAVLYDGAELTRFPTYDVSPIVDTTGAGDAFTAALTLRYIETGDIRAAIDRGNAAGSLAITKLGAQNGMPDAGALDRLQARGLRA